MLFLLVLLSSEAKPKPSLPLLSLYPTQQSVDELERVAASYLLRPRGSMCLSSGNALEDNQGDDGRFADDGSVYIYREGDSSSSAEDPPRGRDNQHEEDAEYGGDDDSDRNRRNFFAPPDVGDDRARHDNDGRLWQDKRPLEPSSVRTQEAGRSSSGREWGVSGGDVHRGVSVQRTENRSAPMQRGGGGGDVAAGVNSKDSNRQGEIDLQAWQQEEQQRIVGPSGGSDLASRKQMGSGGGAQQVQPGVGRAPEPLAATLDGRKKKNDRSFLPGRGFGGETPAETFTVPVPGASYSAKVGTGLQGRGGRDTTVARGLGAGDDPGPPTEPSAKVRQAADRLRSMILERQVSANRSTREVFGHFDRRRCGYVNVVEMRDALADLRLNLSPEEGKVSEDRERRSQKRAVLLVVFCDTRYDINMAHSPLIFSFRLLSV